MTGTLTIELTGFAFRACEAPLNWRQKILDLSGEMVKLAVAASLLPFVYALAWFTILVAATLALLLVRTERKAIRKHRGKLNELSPEDLREAIEGLKWQLSRLQNLARLDRTIRPLSPMYSWLLSGFDEDLKGFISAYDTLLISIQLESTSCDPVTAPVELSGVEEVLMDMRPAHRSLRDKAREEMSEFEREHHW